MGSHSEIVNSAVKAYLENMQSDIVQKVRPKIVKLHVCEPNKRAKVKQELDTCRGIIESLDQQISELEYTSGATDGADLRARLTACKRELKRAKTQVFVSKKIINDLKRQLHKSKNITSSSLMKMMRTKLLQPLRKINTPPELLEFQNQQ